MRQTEFKQWLRQSTTFNIAVQGNIRSRCNRVEDAQGDLDQHFINDRMATLLGLLKYSSAEQQLGIDPRYLVQMRKGVNVQKGISCLANAVRVYIRFCEESSMEIERMPSPALGTAEAQVKTRQGVRAKPTYAGAAWPTWNSPDEADLLQLAKITTPYIRFLHPDLVRAIVEDNETHRVAWETRLGELGIDPTRYLWERSACAFPGVRRHAGSREIAIHRRSIKRIDRLKHALKIDDNHYPKMVWSYLLKGKPFQNQGPSDYSLAHLADHKEYKNRGQSEFDLQQGITVCPILFGLFTSVANTVYLPGCLMRPTDFNATLRNLILRRAHQLYGDFCNLLPPCLTIRSNESKAWSLDAFHWCKPAGTMSHVSAFLNYRAQEMERLFSVGPIGTPEEQVMQSLNTVFEGVSE
jgi:hypothetical protein